MGSLTTTLKSSAKNSPLQTFQILLKTDEMISCQYSFLRHCWLPSWQINPFHLYQNHLCSTTTFVIPYLNFCQVLTQLINQPGTNSANVSFKISDMYKQTRFYRNPRVFTDKPHTGYKYVTVTKEINFKEKCLSYTSPLDRIMQKRVLYN